MSPLTKVIDCDVHNQFNHYTDLVPYLKEPWKSRVASLGIHVGFTYTSPIGVMRKDAVPPNGGKPGSSPDYLYKQLIEEYQMEYAILTGDDIMHLSVNPDPDYAAALASAYNDYLVEVWLRSNKKFKGSLVVTTQDPQLAAKEIDRLGSHPDIVQVIMASASAMPLGQRFYHPIYEAAERNGLPIAIHPGSEGGGASGAPTSAGYPSNYLQWHTCLSQNFMAQLVSLVCEGVMVKYPGLKFVLTEGGVTWLPHVMWRLDKNYKGLRHLAPWLKKLPSQYIRDSVYFTTQPIEEPDDASQLTTLLNMIDAENILMFSSDYPHWDFDSPTMIWNRMPKAARSKIFYENAKALYRLE
ncbi:amidohydrolase family protein [Paenibacillus cymbidii]|uniref:amidohydrolase family protein n=1 Tax=Paenibacillus cymbidii TaxID=1639034 RepID=UPI00108076EC|nr:amidohydrolase family protein [Paenibacillus cymbidii]